MGRHTHLRAPAPCRGYSDCIAIQHCPVSATIQFIVLRYSYQPCSLSHYCIAIQLPSNPAYCNTMFLAKPTATHYTMLQYNLTTLFPAIQTLLQYKIFFFLLSQYNLGSSPSKFSAPNFFSVFHYIYIYIFSRNWKKSLKITKIISFFFHTL